MVVIREIEQCPRCGQYSPWRKTSSRVVRGERRIYAKCWRCGARSMIIYRRRAAVDNLPAAPSVLTAQN